jgi:hypothetical protein
MDGRVLCYACHGRLSDTDNTTLTLRVTARAQIKGDIFFRA